MIPTNSTQPTPLQAKDFNLAAMQSIADPVARLRVIMKRLLDPGGCPWDREQTHATLRQYTIEEVFEVAEAIDDNDDDALCEELGDVALQVVFHSELADRRGAFRLEDVYTAICDKLIRRHPHVFGSEVAEDSTTVLANWEQIKKGEKKKRAAKTGDDDHASALAGVPKALPALQRAARMQEKAARVGFDWVKIEDVAGKVREEIEEFLEHATHAHAGAEHDAAALEEEFGDLLFSLVNISRFMNLRAEEALQKGCAKFSKRFMAIERAAEAQGHKLTELTLAQMDALWDAVKHAEKG